MKAIELALLVVSVFVLLEKLNFMFASAEHASSSYSGESLLALFSRLVLYCSKVEVSVFA